MIKQALRRLLGDVAVWRVFRWDADQTAADSAPQGVACRSIDASEVAKLPDPLLAEQSWYGGEGAHGFAGMLEGGVIAGLCFHWHGARYSLNRFWPLGDDEAMIIQIVTTPAARGRGVARALIQHSSRALATEGWCTLWARVWISNAPSCAAFSAAGWRQVAWVLEVNPLRRKEPWCIRLRRPFT